MAIKRLRHGNRVYLAEYKSIRKGRKVISKYVRYLGLADDQEKAPLHKRGRMLDRLAHGAAVQAGAVRLLWSLAEDLRFRATIDGMCGRASSSEASPGRLLTAWAINRVMDPESATQLEFWAAGTELPSLMGLPAEALNKDAFLRSLDSVCRHEPAVGGVVDRTAELDAALYRRWREIHPLTKGAHETLAYDLTSVLFFGVTCPIAELGYNPDHDPRPQVKVAVVASKVDHAPVLHRVYGGGRQSRGTWRNLLAGLDAAKVEPGLLISDRGVLSKDLVKEGRRMGWHVLGGVAKTEPVSDLLARQEVPETPRTLAVVSRNGAVYAVKVRARVWGAEREAVVYSNAEKGIRERSGRNEELAKIGDALGKLAREGADRSEAELHAEIAGIVGTWGRYVNVSVRRKDKGSGPRVIWDYRTRELERAAREDGKYLLLCTDERMTAIEVVRAYFSKDFVEKLFRTLKTDLEVEPVRHRLEHRVRAYLFVCMLAYRLAAALRWQVEMAGVEEDAAEYLDDLLRDLSRVEKVEVRLGNEARTWFLNVTDRVKEGLEKLGKKDLLKEETRLIEVV
jgi:hypothetical protein